MSTPIQPEGTSAEWGVQKAPNAKCATQQSAEIIHNVS